MTRLALILGTLIAATAVAGARPPPPPEDPPAPTRPGLEWSTWMRASYGVAPHATEGARLVVGSPTPGTSRDRGWEGAVGVDLTVAIGHGGDVRFGPFLEASSSGAAVIGGELVIAALPKKLDMFWYAGEGVLIARAGTDGELVTGALSYGYRAPWDLLRPRHRDLRYQIGLRAVATYTRAIDDPRDWTTTVGLEVEPVGALRYLLGIRGWY